MRGGWLGLLGLGCILCWGGGLPLYGKVHHTQDTVYAAGVEPGAWQLNAYVPELVGKRVGVVCNAGSRVGERHLVDTLLALGVQVRVIFSPEHGFKGTAAEGARVGHSVAYDSVWVYSLYGASRSPSDSVLSLVDIILYDLQDVGVRCYTYLSTLQLLLEASQRQREPVPVVVLDRPNPNGHFVAGPVLDSSALSFVGKHPVPWVHGMTVGEFAQMIVGEGWLPLPVKDEEWVRVVRCKGYTHSVRYVPPVAPSPNLPTLRSILLYPSVAPFEATRYSVGRGTAWPFEVVGAPGVQGMKGGFTFRPQKKGAVHTGKWCKGLDLRHVGLDSLYDTPRIRWEYLAVLLAHTPQNKGMLQRHFDRFMGAPGLATALLRGDDITQWEAKWEKRLSRFRLIRARYLLYPDSERETEALRKILEKNYEEH